MSITNATLAIYPLSSSNDRKKNKITIIGKKFNTLPTPVNIPSTTSDLSTSLTCMLISALSQAFVTKSIAISIRLESHAPTTPKVIQNINAIIATNEGIAVYFPVSTLSIF